MEVQYEGYCFWIDVKDFASKRVFAFLMLILMLSETGADGKLPVLTGIVHGIRIKPAPKKTCAISRPGPR